MAAPEPTAQETFSGTKPVEERHQIDQGALEEDRLDELLERAVVVALPLATRFRGVTVREAMLTDLRRRPALHDPQASSRPGHEVAGVDGRRQLAGASVVAIVSPLGRVVQRRPVGDSQLQTPSGVIVTA